MEAHDVFPTTLLAVLVVLIVLSVYRYRSSPRLRHILPLSVSYTALAGIYLRLFIRGAFEWPLEVAAVLLAISVGILGMLALLFVNPDPIRK
jgi:hypothetical protein